MHQSQGSEGSTSATLRKASGEKKLISSAGSHVECRVETEANGKPCWVEVTKAAWTQWLSKVGCVWDDTLQYFKGPAFRLQTLQRKVKYALLNSVQVFTPSLTDPESMWPVLFCNFTSKKQAKKQQQKNPALHSRAIPGHWNKCACYTYSCCHKGAYYIVINSKCKKILIKLLKPVFTHCSTFPSFCNARNTKRNSSSGTCCSPNITLIHFDLVCHSLENYSLKVVFISHNTNLFYPLPPIICFLKYDQPSHPHTGIKIHSW